MKKTVKATTFLLLVFAAMVSCKKQDDADPPQSPTNVDTSKSTGNPPKVYDEIWVIDPASSSGYTEYDTLKITNRQEYIANGDSCIMLWGDTAKTAGGKIYIPQLLINLGNATTQLIDNSTSRYTVKQLTPSINNIEINLTYTGMPHESKFEMVIPYDAVYAANTKLDFIRIK
jgi:hypothetical protein